ncbi:MAG: LPS export ABC transporter permease LptG [Chromatiales bacterium]
MRILDSYLGRTITGAVATVIVFLVAAFTFFSFLEELSDVGRGGYSVLVALQFVLLRIPALTYQLFPVAALIGALLGLGTLVANSEMVAVRAAGVSLGQTILAVMKAGFVLVVIAILIGEFLAPRSEQMARSLRSLALTDQIALKTRNGFWARDGNSFINIRTVLPGDRVEDIYIYEFDKDSRLRVSTYAKAAQYTSNQWLLTDIKQTSFGDDSIRVQHIARAAWESLLRPELIGLVIINPNNLSMWNLMSYIGYLRENSQNTLRYEQALWSKIVYPLATGAMVFLAVPLVFASARVTSVGGRIVIGSLVGVTFHILNQAAGHLGVVFNLSPVVSVLAPTLLVFIAGLVLLRRVS